MKSKCFKIFRIMETSYEDGTSWVEYICNGKYGYEIIEDIKEIKSFNEIQICNKPNLNICSNYLAEIIEECRQSENEMWFVEWEDLEEILSNDEGDIKSFLAILKDEVEKLELSDYIKFEEDGVAITVYGGVITKFLF